MLLKGGYYYDLSIKKNRDISPKGHILFVLASGYTKPITVSKIETIHPYRRDYQLIYVHNGSFHYFEENGAEHIVPAGNFILFKPNEYQKYVVKSEEVSEYYWCHFSGTFAETLLKNYDLYDKKVIYSQKRKQYRRLFNSLRLALENKPKNYIELCSLYLQTLIVTINSDISDKVEYPLPVTKALEYLQNYYHEEITIDQLSTISLSNPVTLNRNFIKYLGTTPKKYLIKLRIEKAKTLLLQTEHKINEISLAVGFQNPLYFSTAFKNETGMSPKAYRNQER